MWISHAIINHLLLQQPPLKEALAVLKDRTFRLTVMGMNLDMLIGADGYVSAPTQDSIIECHITLHAQAWGKFLQSQPIGVGDIEIDGDCDLAMQILAVLGQLQYMPYVDATRLFGNTVASHLDNTAKTMLAHVKTAAVQLEGEIKDFMLEANAPVVSYEQWQTHSEAIDALRDDVARLQARLRRLQ